jgi:hypothetical protein
MARSGCHVNGCARYVLGVFTGHVCDAMHARAHAVHKQHLSSVRACATLLVLCPRAWLLDRFADARVVLAQAVRLGPRRELTALRTIPTRVAEAERLLSQHSLKGVVDPHELLRRIVQTAPSRLVSAAFRGSVTARRQRFLHASRTRAGDAAVLTALCNATASTVLAIGDGYAGTRAKKGERHGRAPVKGLIRYLARFVRVVLLSEYRTSANCAVCVTGKMTYARDRDGSCNACGGHRNRDENACALMLKVVHSLVTTGRRPAPLRRSTDDDGADAPSPAAQC